MANTDAGNEVENQMRFLRPGNAPRNLASCCRLARVRYSRSLTSAFAISWRKPCSPAIIEGEATGPVGEGPFGVGCVGAVSDIMFTSPCPAFASVAVVRFDDCSTPLPFFEVSAATNTAGSSVNPCTKCNPDDIAKIAMREPGRAVFRNCNAC